jgi:hypothetical protein
MSDLLGKFKSEDCCDEGADCHHPNPGPVHEHSKDLALRDYYCKRAILCLSSSNILTPHPPLRPASVSSPPTKAGGTYSPAKRGMGGKYCGRRET